MSTRQRTRRAYVDGCLPTKCSVRDPVENVRKVMISLNRKTKSRCRGVLALTAWALGLVVCAPIVLSAAQVVPLSVEERVRQADAIVLGAVIDRQSRWGDASHRWIVTDFTFAVEDTLYRSSRGDAVG